MTIRAVACELAPARAVALAKSKSSQGCAHIGAKQLAGSDLVLVVQPRQPTNGPLIALLRPEVAGNVVQELPFCPRSSQSRRSNLLLSIVLLTVAR